MPDFSNAITAQSAAEWRTWLAQNHATEKNVWLIIYHKKSDKKSVYYDEAVDEAMCYGWVDSSIRKRDGESYYQYFSQRSPKSNWSRVNKEKIARLEKEGKMAEAGRTMVRIAKERGTWDALNDVENLVIPTDMQALFDKMPAAETHWQNFPRSTKRSILEWIFNAKRPATRAKRIREAVEKAVQNIRANQ